MSKTTFIERFQRANKFYDKSYHHHKATFKGLSQFFKNYCSAQKDYANQLLKLGQSLPTTIVDFQTELPYIQLGIKQISANIEKVSQLHFNFGERLKEIADYCKQQYSTCKKNKEKFMRLNFEKAREDHEKVKQSKNRNMINEKQKEICKKLYGVIQQYMQDEKNRTQKLKEQLVIYFSLSKKIAQKELELTNTYNLKMAQFELHVKVPQVYEIEDMLVDQFNCYGEERLEKKPRDINQQISINRESLRDSILKRQKILKIQDYQSKMTKIVQKYQQIPEQLNYPNEKQTQIGLFDTTIFQNYRVYSRQFKSQNLRELAFLWISSYYSNKSDDQIKSLLMIIKTNLKVKSQEIDKPKDIPHFIQLASSKSQQYKDIFYFIIGLSQLYYGNIKVQEFNNLISVKKSSQSQKKPPNPLHWKIFIVIIDILLDSLIIIRDGFSILYDDYFEMLKLIIDFSKTVFNIDPKATILLLLRKIERALIITNSNDEEIIEEIFQQKIDSAGQYTQTQGLKLEIGHRIINFLTEKTTKFYKCKIGFSNLVKLSLCIQKNLPRNYFTALEHMHKCIKIAGFNFFMQSDEDKKVTEGGVWKGEQRLKNLTEVLESFQYDQIRSNYFEPMARSLAKLVGVGFQVICNKMVKQFLAPTCQIIKCNIEMLSEQEGTDRQGYILRLGICLTQLDLQLPQDIAFYDSYFEVLETYLQATEKDYDNLLQHSRKTELWIAEQNSQATQNCIDFCSMLYKPFEFLLTSLKKLEDSKIQTSFTKKFTQFIKLKLNKALKGQIQKYIKFLTDSLSPFTSRGPQLALKPKRLTQIIQVTPDQLTKQRYTYREMTRRIYNLTFLKDQLDEIVCDFIDKGVYQEIGFSIFNVDKLQIVSSKTDQHKDILQNILSIATLISKTESKLIQLIASITVYHFFKRLFSNLYFQEQKGFFSSNDYKLSQFTLVKYQKELEEVLTIISRNIPVEIIDQFSKLTCSAFWKAFRFQALNSTKFKIGLSQENIITFLKADLGFACNVLKKKCFEPNVVMQMIEEPSKAMFKDMQKQTQKLMESFSEASLKNNNDEARYYLAILNLKKDEKAEQFVQKYKKMIK